MKKFSSFFYFCFLLSSQCQVMRGFIGGLATDVFYINVFREKKIRKKLYAFIVEIIFIFLNKPDSPPTYKKEKLK